MAGKRTLSERHVNDDPDEITIYKLFIAFVSRLEDVRQMRFGISDTKTLGYIYI